MNADKNFLKFEVKKTISNFFIMATKEKFRKGKTMARTGIIGFLIIGALFPLPPQASAHPLLRSQERSPRIEAYFKASMVLVGKFTNFRQGKGENGTTDFIIEEVLKSHAIIADKKNLTLTVPNDFEGVLQILQQIYQVNHDLKKPTNTFLVFFHVANGKIEPFGGCPTAPKGELSRYLQGAGKLKDRPIPERLHYCFDFLKNPDHEVCLDAFEEFSRANYKDFKAAAGNLPPQTLNRWLRNPNTPPNLQGLSATLIGHCGTKEHAQFLRSKLEDPKEWDSLSKNWVTVRGFILGFLMLEPKEGWDFLQRRFGNPKESWLTRYAALEIVRHLHKNEPTLVGKNELVQGLLLGLEHTDMADLAIESLRKWKQWDQTEKVLNLFKRPSHQSVPPVRRAILSFALQSNHPQGRMFVQEQRKRDPNWVSATEEWLELRENMKMKGKN